jgi:hypothetical protein
MNRCLQREILRKVFRQLTALSELTVIRILHFPGEKTLRPPEAPEFIERAQKVQILAIRQVCGRRTARLHENL